MEILKARKQPQSGNIISRVSLHCKLHVFVLFYSLPYIYFFRNLFGKDYMQETGKKSILTSELQQIYKALPEGRKEV